jgi:hypothetical protein
MTIAFTSPRRSVLAADLLAMVPADHIAYAHPDRSFSPFWSNIGLTFGDQQGIGTVHLHYNRRTIALGGPALAANAAALGRSANVACVRDAATATAFFATDSFLIESRVPLTLGLLSDPALRVITDDAVAGGIRQIHAMVKTIDPRDPDAEVPVLVSIRMLAGAEAGPVLSPDARGFLCAAIRFDILSLDRVAACVALAQCPQTVAEAEALTHVWITSALSGLALHPADDREAEVLARSVLTLLFNTVAAPGQMAGRLASYPSRGGYPTHFLWDACFQMLGLEDMDPRLARDALLLISDTMRADGLMAHFICSTWIRPDASQPPLFGWAAERLVTRTGDMNLATDVLSAMRRNTDWWLSQRMTSRGLIACFDPFETGWDDTPRLDHGPIIACDMNAYLLMQMRSSARIAARLGLATDASAITAQADAFAQRMVELLYDTDTNRFHDMLIKDGRHLPILSPAVFLPLLGDMPLPPKRQIDMLGGLFDPARLYGRIPFPCVSYDDPAYDPQLMWRGPMWPPIYWLLLELMDKFDMTAQRAESATTLYRIILKDGHLHEYFDSQTGAGLGFPQQGWTAAIFLRLHADLAAGAA